MKIVRLRPYPNKSGRKLWAFNLILEGFLVNGFLFNEDTGSIMPPRIKGVSGRPIRMVNAFGKQWLKLRPLIQEGIAKTLDTHKRLPDIL